MKRAEGLEAYYQPMASRAALQQWARFVRADGHILRQYPGLLFQQAANQPTTSAPAISALTRWNTSVETRPWIQLVNKPGTASACVLTIAGHRGGVGACDWSRDGRWILSGSEDSTLRIWDVSTAAEVLVLEGHADGVTCCRFSPDGRRVVSGASDLTVRVWDTDTGGVICATEPFLGFTGSVSATAFLDKGRIVAAARGIGLFDGLKVFDGETGREIAALGAGDGPVATCVVSPDGRLILSASGTDAVLWDALTFRRIATLGGHRGPVSACAFSPDGQRILTSASAPTIPFDPSEVRLWDARTRQVLTSWYEPDGLVNAARFSPDNSMILLALGKPFFPGALRLRDAAGGADVHRWTGHSKTISDCCFSPDGRTFVTASGDCTLKVWSADATGIEDQEGHNGEVAACAFTPDGQRLVSASGFVFSPVELKTWDGDTGRVVAEWEGGPGWVTTCSFSPDGRRLVSGAHEQALRVWDAVDRTLLLTLPLGTDRAGRASFSPDGTRLLTVAGNNRVLLWDATTGAQVAQPSIERAEIGIYSPDGSRILIGGYVSLLLLDARTGAAALTLEVPRDFYIASAAFSPDGRRVAAGCSAFRRGDGEDGPLRCGDLAIWDAEQGGEPLLTIEAHTDSVSQCGYSPDGVTLFSLSADGVIRLYDAAAGRPEKDLYGLGVRRCCWFPDSRSLLLQTGERALEIWDVERWACTLRIELPNHLSALTLAAAGELIAAGDCLGSVYLLRPTRKAQHPS